MKTYSVTVYEYDDLSDTAKARARDWFREISVSDTDFADSVIEDAKHIAEILGIYFKDRAINTVGGKTRYEPAIYWSGFSSQGDGASFEGQYSWSVDMPHRIRQYAPQDETLHQIADDLAEIQEKHGNQLTATITQSGHYTHEHTMQAEVQRLDEDDQSLEVDPRFSDALLEVFRRFARWIYRQLEQEYEYQTSDEQVAETIRINEYEFYADGRRACLPQEIQK